MNKCIAYLVTMLSMYHSLELCFGWNTARCFPKAGFSSCDGNFSAGSLPLRVGGLPISEKNCVFSTAIGSTVV